MIAVLGIHLGHDASVCLTIDGKVSLAIQEERFSRVKNHTGYPFRSLKVVRKYLDNKSIDEIYLAVAQNKFTKDIDTSLPLLISRLIIYKYPRGINRLIYLLGRFYNIFLKKNKLNEFLWRRILLIRTSLFLRKRIIRINFFDHHKCHAASAAYSSGFDECIVFTSDGKGDLMSGSGWNFYQNNLQNIYYQKEEDSIGQIYAEVTRFLGFKPNRHEGKVTGLAAAGNPKTYIKFFDDLTLLDENNLIKRTDKLSNYNLNAKLLQQKFNNNLNKSRRSDIAASLQFSIEKIFINHCKKFINNKTNIALAGGVFANVKINQEIRNLKNCLNLFVQPAMGDSGLSMGAAQLMNFEYGIKNVFQKSALLGTSYSNSYIENFLKGLKYDISYSQLESNIYSDIAKEIYNGKIIGLFQGKMEWGPRALSSRSILANPINKNINDQLNSRLNRSDFMPFAPVVLKDDMNDIFLDWKENDRTSQYMTSTYNINTDFEDLISAIVHIDKTARPQSVSYEDYPFLYKVLKEVKKLSGIGVLINTSFNLHEEPIVESPKDVIRALRKKAIDILYIGNFRVELRVNKK